MAGLIYHPEAKVDISKAARFYESKRRGWGEKFLTELETVLDKLRRNPLRCPKVSEPFRCCLIKRFPFGIIYAVEGDEVFVGAVIHMKRKPGYWKKRFSPERTDTAE